MLVELTSRRQPPLQTRSIEVSEVKPFGDAVALPAASSLATKRVVFLIRSTWLSWVLIVTRLSLPPIFFTYAR